MSAVSISLWIMVWVAGLSALVWLARERLVPALESHTQASVTTALGRLSDATFDVSVQGYSTRLSGMIDDAAQRSVLIEAAYRVNGVREVIDALDLAEPVDAGSATTTAARTLTSRPPPDSRQSAEPVRPNSNVPGLVKSGDPLVNDFTLAVSGKTTLPPRRRADGMPRTKVFGAILPPWRAPAVFSEPSAQRVVEQAAESITFRISSHRLTADSRRALDELAKLMSEFEDLRLDIGGHTDSIGGEANNLYLSQARSNSVRDYLATRGISPLRMLALGYGESLPIASNGSVSGRAANRRIEFRLR